MSENRLVASNEERKYFALSGVYSYTRDRFWGAGQDSWTKPPAQDADLFAALTNVEPITQGVLDRRRGYKLFNNSSGVASRRSYSYRNEALSLRRLLWTQPSLVYATDESGTLVNANVFTPSAGATAPRIVTSRDYAYIADGIIADLKKSTTTGGASFTTTNWGIDNKPAPVGPNAPGTASVGSAGPPAWTNINNIKLEDAAFATVTLSSVNNVSQIGLASNFGFTISAGSIISGIKVEIKSKVDVTTQSPEVVANLSFDASNQSGTARSQTPTATNGFLVYGSSTDLWGNAQITPAQVNSTNFAIQFYSAIVFGGTATVHSVDFVRVTVYLSAVAVTLGAPAGTGITLSSGRQYTVIFKNSITGHTSSISAFSVSTGPLTNQGQPISAIPVSPDTQVDRRIILATADGGDQTKLFFVTEITDNTTTTYTDTTPEATLLTQNVYQETDSFGVLHGVFANFPPPNIGFPTKHKGRIFGAIGPTVYFTKNLDEVTTSTGIVTSKWEEAWPATFQFDISAQAETIIGMLSDGENLYIATERTIRRLTGDSPANFQKPEVAFNEAGLATQDTWKLVFHEDQPAGTMWLTPDLRIMFSDFNSYVDVGTPVQDVLNTINQGSLSNAHSSFVSRGAYDLWMLYIPTGGNTDPDTCLVYDLRAKRWLKWLPTDTVTTSLFNIDATGLPRWMFGASTGTLYEWDPVIAKQDRVNNTPVSYTMTVQTSFLDLGDATIRKCLNQILVTTNDTLLTIAVDGATLDADLISPISVIAATTVTLGPLGDLFVPLAGALSKYKWYRFTFTSPVETVGNVLEAYSIECVPFMRW